MFQQKDRLDASLPPTSCTVKMREQIIKIAKEEGVSLAEVQRHALALFLAGFVEKIDKNGRETEQEEQAS